jgi:predicted protein tyrosine phosphatase
MRVHAMGREAAEAYRPWTGLELCISITDPADPVYGVERRRPADLSDDFLAILRLEFLDLDERLVSGVVVSPETRAEIDELMINDEQARHIAEFVQRAVTLPASALIVHCEAGVSRSVGCARAIDEYRGATPASSRALHGRGNTTVREKVLEALGGPPRYPEDEP